MTKMPTDSTAELQALCAWLKENRDAWVRHILQHGKPIPALADKLQWVKDDLQSSVDAALEFYAEGNDVAAEEALKHARFVAGELTKMKG